MGIWFFGPWFFGSCLLHLRRVQLPNLFQFDAQPVAKRAFRSQLIEQSLCLFEDIRWHILALKEIAKATLYFGFG